MKRKWISTMIQVMSTFSKLLRMWWYFKYYNSANNNFEKGFFKGLSVACETFHNENTNPLGGFDFNRFCSSCSRICARTARRTLDSRGVADCQGQDLGITKQRVVLHSLQQCLLQLQRCELFISLVPSQHELIRGCPEMTSLF